jgi:hypothetical protein
LSSVLFPAPFLPIIPSISPSFTCKSTFLRAQSSPVFSEYGNAGDFTER